jgi:hypothetical protein
MEFGRAMDLIEAERVQRGLPSLKVKAARDLAQMKRQITAGIAAKFPEWYADFSVVDRGAAERKVAGMREIAADDRLAGRDDIAGLREYLQLRDLVSAELTKRAAVGGAKSLDAADNTDLDGLWEQIKGAMLERNLAFSSLYYRWLSHDTPGAA